VDYFVPDDDLLIELRSKIETLIARVGDLRNDTSALKQDVSTARSDTLSLKVDVSGLKSDISTLKSDTSTLKSDTSALKVDTSALKSDSSTLKTDASSLKDAKDDFLQFKSTVTNFKGTVEFYGRWVLGLGAGLIAGVIWVASSIVGLQSTSTGLQVALGKDEQQLANFRKDTDEITKITSSLPTTLQSLEASVKKVIDANNDLSKAESQQAADLKQIKDDLNNAVGKISALSAKAGSEGSGQQTMRIAYGPEDYKGTESGGYIFDTKLANPISKSNVDRSILTVLWLEGLPPNAGSWQASAALSPDGTGCRLTIFSQNPLLKTFLPSNGVGGLLSLSSR
jgi:peptidoglycan hydrolase CwlO-like protein